MLIISVLVSDGHCLVVVSEDHYGHIPGIADLCGDSYICREIFVNRELMLHASVYNT